MSARDDALHPLQAAFIEHDALQCGFCTPGQILAAVALLDENPNPTEDDVVRGMSGNLCRCGTYPKIVRAVLAVAEAARRRMTKRFVTTKVEIEGREETKVVELPSRNPTPWAEDAELHIVGQRVPADGRARKGHRDGALHGRHAAAPACCTPRFCARPLRAAA